VIFSELSLRVASANLLPSDGEVFYCESFFSQEISDAYFSALCTEVKWKQEPIVLFGRSVLQPRLTAWIGDEGLSYRYSGITMQPQPWGPVLQEIKSRVEDQAKVTFTSALLNQYRDGSDSMGWHSDDEKELGLNPVIASVSLGATRKFQFRHRHKQEEKTSIDLKHGSLLLMGGETQRNWKHAIPKTRSLVGPRINITFRSLLTSS
jgi:alkylated DNA repair dioxygenase AlkB